MKKASKNSLKEDLKPEYDLSKLRLVGRGKYAQRYNAGTNLVLLAPDVAKYFRDHESVNSILRSLIGVLKAQRGSVNKLG